MALCRSGAINLQTVCPPPTHCVPTTPASPGTNSCPGRYPGTQKRIRPAGVCSSSLTRNTPTQATMPSRWTSVLLGVCVLAVVLSEVHAAQQCFTWTLYSEDFEKGFQTSEAWKVLRYERYEYDDRRHGGVSSQKSGSVLAEKDRRHSGGTFIFPQFDCNDPNVRDTHSECDDYSDDDSWSGWVARDVDVDDNVECYRDSLTRRYKDIYGECMFGQFDDDKKPQLRLSNLPMHSSITIALNIVTENDWQSDDDVDISENGNFLFEFSEDEWEKEKYNAERFTLERSFFKFADGNGD
eukprot:3851164-Rhodomonas_salina.1